MGYKLRLRHFGGASVLALLAAGCLNPTQTAACTASPDSEETVTSVTVNCLEGSSAPFATSFSAQNTSNPDAPLVYSGNGDDIVDVFGGGSVTATAPQPPTISFVNPSFVDGNLNGSTAISTLGGDDLVFILNGGTVGANGAPVSVLLGAGDDGFDVSFGGVMFGNASGEAGVDHFDFFGGNFTGNVSAGEDDDLIHVFDGTIVGNVSGDAGDDEMHFHGGVVGAVATPVLIDAGEGNDDVVVGGDIDENCDCVAASQMIVHGAVQGGGGNDTISIEANGTVEGNVDAGGGNDTVTLLGGTIGIVGTPAIVDLGDGNDSFRATGAVEESEGGPEVLQGILHGRIQGGEGDDTVTIQAAGVIEGGIDAGNGNDTVRLEAGEEVFPVPVAVPVVGIEDAPTTIDLGAGADFFEMTSGVLYGSLLGQAGADTFEIGNGTITGFVAAGDGDDTVTISLGEIGGDVSGDTGSDTMVVAGGTIAGSVLGGEGDDGIAVSGGTINGSLFAGSGNDTVTISDAANILGDAELGPDAVGLEDGNDTFNMTGGALGGAVSGGNGNDVMTIGGGTIATFVAGNRGADQITVSGGAIGGEILGGDDDDIVTIGGGTIAADVSGDAGNDTVRLFGGTVGTIAAPADIDLGAGADLFEMSAGTVTGSVFGLGGGNIHAVSGGTINGSLFAGSENDTVTISGTANIRGDAATGPDAVGLEDGNDTFNMTGGTLGGAVSGGNGIDVMTIRGGTIASFVAGNQGADQITVAGGAIGGEVLGGEDDDVVIVSGGAVATNVSGDDGNDDITISAGAVGGNASGGAGDDTVTVEGGTVAGSVTGGDGNDQLAVKGGRVVSNVSGDGGVDTVSVEGGRIDGNVEGETIHLSGGSIGGDISGISGNTLIINGSPTTLDLRNGVVISGTNAVGSITNANLALGGAETQVFTGFDRVALDASSIGFGTGNIGIAQLNLANGSTLFVRGNANMAGSLDLTGSAIDMIDGVDDDILTLGGIAISNGSIGIDLNQQTLHADQLIAGAFSATGANTIAVNLLGAPEFAGATDIPVIFTNVPIAPGTFRVVGVPGTPASLFTYEVVAGANGGLFIRASPGNFGVAVATENAIDVGTVDTAVDAVYGINDDAIAADLGLAGGTAMAPISETFGVFASGQLAHVEHDGFTVTNNNLVGTGPSFDADDFSAAISLDFNAGKQLGLDTKYGLNLGLFAGYASTDVGLGTFQGFSRVGDADNKSGMFGGYGLFRQGQNYLLVSTSVFLGETDVTNGVLNTTGNYGTEGYVVTGSAGHIFNITDRARFDLRGGLMGVSFTGGDFVDSGGNQFGKSEISFGAIKLEPGVYADYQLDNGMVISPYARADLQQRFGYTNTAIIDGREIDFDDSDFSAALSSGFNLRMTKTATLSGEIRGKFSSDSSTFGGKLGFKIAF